MDDALAAARTDLGYGFGCWVINVDDPKLRPKTQNLNAAGK